MTRSEIRECIEFFFDVIERGAPGDDIEARLVIALDRLALASNYGEYQFDESDYPEAEGRDYITFRELISKRFPGLGFYNVAEEIGSDIGNGRANVGDAIDDICDIAGDLEEVLWRWDNNSPDDAMWYFSNFYVFHWGRHLRRLQLYLYDRRT